MNITHFGHACVLVELDGGGRLLLDPGTYSGGFEEVTGLDAVLFTHEHPDHLDLGRLPALLKANPGARVIADPGTSARLGEAAVEHETVTDGATVSVADATVQVVGGDHAVIHPDLPCPHNNGYLIDSVLYHPGDAFAPPPAPARVLLLPTGAPWMKAAEGIDYLRAVAPEIAIPIHQGGLAEVHRHLHYQLFRNLGPDTTDVRVLDEGAATAI